MLTEQNKNEIKIKYIKNNNNNNNNNNNDNNIINSSEVPLTSESFNNKRNLNELDLLSSSDASISDNIDNLIINDSENINTLNNIDTLIFMNYIKYLSNPLFFDNKFNLNISSYYSDFYFTHSMGQELQIKYVLNLIDIFKTVYSTNAHFIDYLNENSTYFKKQDLSEFNQDMLTMPKYIYPMNGSVLNKLITDNSITNLEYRRLKYGKLYNITCNYFDWYNLELIDNSEDLYYYDYTDNGFINCKSYHLSLFTTKIIYNEGLYTTDSRLYFLKYPILFLDIANNLLSNFCFLLCLILNVVFILLSLLFYCIDKGCYSKQKDSISYMKKSIIHEKYKYYTKKDIENKIKRIDNIIDTDELNADFIINFDNKRREDKNINIEENVENKNISKKILHKEDNIDLDNNDKNSIHLNNIEGKLDIEANNLTKNNKVLNINKNNENIKSNRNNSNNKIIFNNYSNTNNKLNNKCKCKYI